MHTFFDLGNLHIPMYGICIMFGVITANLLAILVLKKHRLDLYDFLVLEGYSFLGAFIGAKALYLFVSRDIIAWDKFLDWGYVNTVMKGGFVFYGGLIVGILFVFMAGRIHRILAGVYLEKVAFVIPWVHGFGRIGCFMAGCCYGKPYSGPGAVVFPKGSFAPYNSSLFPVQLVEATCLLLLAIFLLLLQRKKKQSYTLEIYLMVYSILRFILEYARDDSVRGSFLFFSTSQWISLGLLFAGISMYTIKHKRQV